MTDINYYAKINEKILNYYDNDFNNNYDNNQKISGHIDTREGLIRTNDFDSDYKDNIILILKYFLILLLFSFVVVLGFIFKLYSLSTMKYIFLLSFILYVVITYYQIYYNQYTVGNYRVIDFGRKKTQPLFANVIRNILPPDSCPTGCKPKLPIHCPPDMPNCDKIQDNTIREMNTDSTLNNWAKGDYKAMGCQVDKKSGKLICDMKNSKKLIYDSPRPWFKPVDNPTMHTCQTINGEVKSSIPCQYFI